MGIDTQVLIPEIGSETRCRKVLTLKMGIMVGYRKVSIPEFGIETRYQKVSIPNSNEDFRGRTFIVKFDLN